MEDFNLTLSLNNAQLQVTVHPHTEGEKTFYDILFEDYTLTIYKDTLYTWASDDAHGLSQADVQSVGEQINNT